MDMSTSQDHGAHDHASMAGGHSMDHGTGVERRPDGSYYYTHGGFLGHIVPGVFFIVWGTWWMIATFHYYIRACAAVPATPAHRNSKSDSSTTTTGFTIKPWYQVFFGPSWFRAIPLEPWIKVILPLFGILGELWLGHSQIWQNLYKPDGTFQINHINNWQHSAMYLTFTASGVIDLIGHYFNGPPGADHAFLGLAFLTQFLLLIFHLKGPSIEILLHLILGLQVGATVVSIIFEAYVPRSIVVASLRPSITILQGVWWIQTAYVMFVSNPAYDPDSMGGAMMVPVLFCTHMLWVAVASYALLMVMKWLYSVSMGRNFEYLPLHYGDRSYYPHADKHSSNGFGERDDEYLVDGPDRALELAGLTTRMQK